MTLRSLHLIAGFAGLTLASAAGGCSHNPQPGEAARGRWVGDTGAAAEPGGLQGTTWRLEDLGGAGVLDGAEATLEFPAAGKVAGRGDQPLRLVRTGP
jgi:hypothetical protein